MNLRLSTIILVVLCMGAISCKSQQSSTAESGKLSPDQAATERRVLVAWFECEECTSGELEAVVKLGPAVVPSLAATLLSGPPPASREIQRDHLVQTYKEMQAYGREHPREAKTNSSEEDYVRMYSENYVALYQTRAARALGAIGGEQARNALTEALKSSAREDVRSSVKEALQKMGAPRSD